MDKVPVFDFKAKWWNSSCAKYIYFLCWGNIDLDLLLSQMEINIVNLGTSSVGYNSYFIKNEKSSRFDIYWKTNWGNCNNKKLQQINTFSLFWPRIYFEHSIKNGNFTTRVQKIRIRVKHFIKYGNLPVSLAQLDIQSNFYKIAKAVPAFTNVSNVPTLVSI